MKFISVVLTVFLAVSINKSFGQDELFPPPGTCGITNVEPKEASRIVNGMPANPHSFPWQCLLLGFFPNGTSKHYCGCSIISPRHILTAAHCVVDMKNDPDNVRIFPGMHYFSVSTLSKDNGIPCREIFVHGSYQASSLNNDVAVLRLKTAVPIDYEKTAPICYPLTTNADAVKVNEEVIATGWGSMSGSPNRTSIHRPTELMQARMKHVPNSHVDCKKLTSVLGFIDQPAKMCAHGEGKSVCFGDSGGPLIRKRTVGSLTYYEQVGIMSGTIDCSFTKPMPDVYANVRYLSKFITDSVKKSP